MKLTHKLCGAALLAVVGASVALPNVTKAVEDSMASKADIEFTKNTTEDTTLNDITNTETLITDLTVTDPGEFGIMAVTPLDFDKHAATFGQEVVYEVKPYLANAASADAFNTENFVAFKDVRSTLDQKHKLSAALTKQFTADVDGNGTMKSLDGASITYTNMHLTQTIGDESQYPTNHTLGEAASGVQTLSFDPNGAGSKLFYQNLETEKGKGRFELVFGSKDQNNIEDSIQVKIPSTANIFNAKYTAEITWTLSDTL